MIKQLSLAVLFALIVPAACNHAGDNYKPGLGEFMSGIQVHHAKLWFAGTAANWKLADFEVGEIKETLDDVEKYCTDRPELASLPMIHPPLHTTMPPR